MRYILGTRGSVSLDRVEKSDRRGYDPREKMSKIWRSIPCHISELRLDITLACGQSFRWKEIEPGTWRSVLSGRIWTLKQTQTHILYQVHNATTSPASGGVSNIDPSGDHASDRPTAAKNEDRLTAKKRGNQTIDKSQVGLKRRKPGSGSFQDVPSTQQMKGDDEEWCGSVLRDYFQLDVGLGALYDQWAEVDANFRKVARGFPGVRILRQDPVENLVSFICSSNNNISRITGMVEKLCMHYGDEIAVLDGVAWHKFPSLSALSTKGVEEKLRKLGFGYRAKFINQTAKMVTGEFGGEQWLWNLRSRPYQQAHSELVKLPGVGAKVADCVCLMSLDKQGAIPVDTHVWQIAARDYMTTLQKTKSLTDRTYREIGNFFRELFGDYAGWAHSVLFSADLKKFQETPKSPTSDKKKQPTSKNKGKESEKKQVR